MARQIRKLRLIVILASLTTLMVSFTNCSHVGDSNKTSMAGVDGRTNPTQDPNYNGGGYGGKTTFVYFSEAPLCTATPNTPEKTIYISRSGIQLSENMCGGQATTDVGANELFANSYDPYYLIYKDDMFVDESLLKTTAANQRASVFSFCYNAVRGLDFAVRKHSYFDNGWHVTTIGHAVSANGSSPAISTEEIGRLPDRPRETPLFVSASYRLEMTHETELKGVGTLSLPSGEQVPMTCHFRK